MADSKTSKKSKHQGKKHKGDAEATFYLRNPGGAIVAVPKSLAQLRLAKPGYELAADAEIDKYLKADVQRHNNPIGPRYEPENQELSELPGEVE